MGEWVEGWNEWRNEMKWNETEFCETKWNEWINDIKKEKQMNELNETRWSEMKWDEVRWEELNWVD
jgi:hypothetical protein